MSARWLLISVAALLLMPAGAKASSRSEIATADGVRAVFTYDTGHDSSGSTTFAHERLRIFRQGAKVLDQAVPCGSAGCDFPPSPYRFYAHRRSVRVVSVDSDSEPEVLLDLSTNGAHCCEYTLLYDRRAATGHYARHSHTWGNATYHLGSGGSGRPPVFVTADDRFAYAFTSYAFSALPVRVLAYRSERFHDATAGFRRLVVRDARQWLHSYRAARHERAQDVRGYLAAYVADEDRLGRHAEASRRLRAALAAGDLRSHSSPGFADSSPSGRHYISALHRFLRRTGYSR